MTAAEDQDREPVERVEPIGTGSGMGTDPAFVEWVEELAGRLQSGEPVDAEACARAHPQWAERLRRLIPAIAVMADLGRSAAARGDGGPILSGGLGPGLGELGDFRLIREIGRGGMGVVYEAEQVSLGRRVALKVLPLATAMDSKQMQRFQLEAHAAACLHHTNIVPVHAVGCERGVPFYAMQYIEGRSLAEVIAELRRIEGWDGADKPAAGRTAGGTNTPDGQDSIGSDGQRCDESGPATPERSPETAMLAPRPGDMPSSVGSTHSREYVHTVARFGVQVAEALDHAHTRGILHRDIKPANLLLDDQRQLWVTDFGLAQIQGSPGLTLTGDILGTLRYMSPEQALAKRVVIDGRTDIYSLGVTLYELLTLRPAVDGLDRQEILRRIAEEETAPPRRLNPTVPSDLETILLKAIAKEPAGRYATAKDLADDLRRFLEDKPVLARRPGPLDRAAKWARRHQGVVATGAAGLLVAAVIIAASAGWIVSDRTSRLAMTEREVNRALDEAVVFQTQANWPEALEAAKRAEGILAAGGSEELRRRVRELRNDVEMVLLLEEIWMPRWMHSWGDRYHRRLAVDYATAFREYGIDVEALEPSAAAARIRARKIRLELALALDSWARLQFIVANPRADATARRLLAVARAADPDEWRNRMRTALEQRDSQALNKLAASAEFGNLPGHTLSLLVSSNSLDSGRAESLLRQAQQAHPDDFHINFQLAWTLAYDPRPHPPLDEAIRFYTAALALRPRNAPTWYWLADVLRARGRVDEQITCDRQAIALDPDFVRPYLALSHALEAQGKRDEAVAVLRKAADTTSDDPQDLNNLSWFLATSYSCELRDARRATELVQKAVELAQKAVELAPELGIYWNTLGAARYRTGNWNAAIAAVEKSMALGGGGNSYDWFYLAMACWQLREPDKARAWYERAVQWMEKNAPGDDELRRLRAEAAELLRRKHEAQSETKKRPD
jgi:serine/threonine protein kinase/Tfp pilus assembly protein PilF